MKYTDLFASCFKCESYSECLKTLVDRKEKISLLILVKKKTCLPLKQQWYREAFNYLPAAEKWMSKSRRQVYQK